MATRTSPAAPSERVWNARCISGQPTTVVRTTKPTATKRRARRTHTQILPFGMGDLSATSGRVTLLVLVPSRVVSVVIARPVPSGSSTVKV